MLHNPASKGISIGQKVRRLGEAVRRAFVEFLKLPTIVIIAFLILGAITFVLDEARSSGS